MHPAIVAGVSSATPALAQEPPTRIASPPVSLIEEFERAGDIDRYTSRPTAGRHAVGSVFPSGSGIYFAHPGGDLRVRAKGSGEALAFTLRQGLRSA